MMFRLILFYAALSMPGLLGKAMAVACPTGVIHQIY